MLHLSAKWAGILASQPESGMGYQIATIRLMDGSVVDDVTIVGGVITGVGGRSEIPFEERDIATITVKRRP